MELKVSFAEANRTFSVEFGEAIDIGVSDYNTGYQHGYIDGETEGFLHGWNEGYDTGYLEGKDESKEPVIESLTITENGTYTAPEGVDGYSPVTVNVPMPDDLFKYSTKIEGQFIRAAFPEGYELTLAVPNALTSLTEFIRQTTGLRKVTLNIPLTQSYKPTYFAYRNTDIEEIVFHDNIKFTDLTYFVSQASSLVKIAGVMDLSESTNNANGFTSCPSLKEVRFKEGTITKSISFNSSSQLSDASIDSIVDGLASVSGQTLTLNSSVLERLSAEQKATISGKGWGYGA